MTETGGAVTWLTQDAYDRLKGELDYLSGEGRVEIAKKIEAAREEGDLRENGGYHAAKEEQGKQEARIRQLRQLLETARVGDAPVPSDGSITSGMVITVDMAGEELVFLLGSREVAGDTDLDVYSEKSPLGVCGANADTVAARNLLREVAAGTAAHSDHGRNLALLLKAVHGTGGPDVALAMTAYTLFTAAAYGDGLAWAWSSVARAGRAEGSG